MKIPWWVDLLLHVGIVALPVWQVGHDWVSTLVAALGATRAWSSTASSQPLIAAAKAEGLQLGKDLAGAAVMDPADAARALLGR